MCGDEIILTCSTSSRTFIPYTITFSPGGRIRLYVILGFYPRREYECLPKNSNVVDNGMDDGLTGSDNGDGSPDGGATGGTVCRPAGARIRSDPAEWEKGDAEGVSREGSPYRVLALRVSCMPTGGSRSGGSIQDISQARPGDSRGEYRPGPGDGCPRICG